MNKKLILVIIAIIIIILGLIFIFSKFKGGGVGPCFGYLEVGEFDQKIGSEYEAKQIALDYYNSIGYYFKPEELSVSKTKNDYLIKPEIGPLNGNSTLPLEKICYGSANPPNCIGQRLILQKKLFGKNKILMDYAIAC